MVMKMSSKKWTPEQEDAIKSETQNILVSAGAGSGKTAVLTQRVISLLNKKIRPSYEESYKLNIIRIHKKFKFNLQNK